MILEVSTTDILEISFKSAVLLAFIYLFLFFKKQYQIQKEKGFQNKFFLGYALMFMAMVIVQSLFTVNLISELIGSDIFAFSRQDFAGHDTDEARETLGFLWNLNRPLYIFGLTILALVFAGQVYPLEETVLGWKKWPITKFNLIMTIPMLLIYIPALTLTYYAAVVIALNMLGIILAFLLNIGINIKLIVSSTGAVRKRSIFCTLGFILLMFGFLWMLEVGWAALIYEGWGHSQDVILGSIVELISLPFYRFGFNLEEL